MEESIDELAKLLRSTSDAEEKVEYYLNMFKEEKKKLERKRHKEIEDGINSIVRSHNELEEMKNAAKNYTINVNKIINYQKEFLEMIKDYNEIKQLTIAHKNFRNANTFQIRLSNLDTEIKEINEIDEIYKRYLKLKDLDIFMLELLYYSDELDKNTFINIKRKINKIEKCTLEFYTTILSIIGSFDFDKEILNNIIKIVEEEEERDNITRKCNKALKTYTEEKEDEIDIEVKKYKKKENSEFFTSLTKEQEEVFNREILKLNKIYAKRKILNLKKKMIHSLILFLDNRFKKLRTEEFFMDKLDFVFEDIKFIHNNLNLEFLPENVLFSRIHKNLTNFFIEKEKKLDATEILSMLEFSENYQNQMEALNKYEFSSKNILGADENVYIEEYLSVVSDKLTAWIENILNSEIEHFLVRSEKPTVDENNKYISSGFINLLQIIKQQLEPVAFHKKIFKGITKTILKNVENFKKEIIKVMEKDLISSYQLKSRPGYEEYVIMIGNSGLKLTQYITSLPQCQEPEIKSLGNIFIDILKKSNNFLATFVIKTCMPAIDLIFTDTWYNSNTTTSLIETIDDFLCDYKISMCEFTFITFIHEIGTAIAMAYLKQLKRKRAKIYMDCASRLEKDYSMLFKLLNKYEEEDEIENVLFINKLIPVIESDNVDIFILELKALLINHPDIGKDVIKSIIKKREDLEEGDKTEWLNRVKELYKEEENEKNLYLS